MSGCGDVRAARAELRAALWAAFLASLVGRCVVWVAATLARWLGPERRSGR